MTYTTSTNSINSSVIYLPTTTWGGVTNPPSTTSWSTFSYDENGIKVLEALTKANEMMTKYAGLINGVIFKELTKRLFDLFIEASCQWGQGYLATGSTNTWTTTTPCPTYTTGTTTGTYTTVGTASHSWYDLTTPTSTGTYTAYGVDTAGTTYSY